VFPAPGSDDWSTPGEVCGLRWSDVDLDAATMTISRNVVEGADGVVGKDTKTHSARRIALDPDTVAVLQSQRTRMEQRAKGCAASVTDQAHIFSGDLDGSRPWTPNEVTKRFIRLRKRASQPAVRLHDLRHFAATRLLAAGVPVRTVSGRLGHANAATTLGVYAHFVEESDRDAAATLGALVRVPKAGTAPRPREDKATAS